jgi:regulator of protease activity HflC (stomatin/prohibitin superfamily)
MSNTTHSIPRIVRKETPYVSVNGYLMVLIAVLLIAAGALMPLPFWRIIGWGVGVPLIVVGVFLLSGLYMLQPNEGIIFTLFGNYKGTDRSDGLRWRNPLQMGQKISLRSRNLNTLPLKVNDKRGNPVEIGAAVVWRVADTAQAVLMLRRQQATAIVSARHQIVAGAVGMVEAALKALSERNLVVLDDERRAAMVSNLLVVLCSDKETQPVVNTGTLYT